jgi:hypothetical protein
MRLDYVSYVTSHGKLADTAQCLGSRLSSTFIDGGVHPRFGTRNISLALQDGHYIEVVCPLDHTASDASPFSKAISKPAARGGGWLTWIASFDDVSKVEARLGRQAVDGLRAKPESHDLSRQQIGVLGTLEDRQLPFSIQWKSLEHPSIDGKAIAKIVKVEIEGDKKQITDLLGNDLATALSTEVEALWLIPADTEGEPGIVAVNLMTPSGVVRVD